MPRVDTILSLLKKTYPNARIVLNYGNSWELLVAVILSAQCTDLVVNKVTERLFAKYKTLDDYINADVSDFEKDIKSTGFYRAKAKNILAAARRVKEEFGGSVPKTMEEMLTIPGVARKTANVVLGNAYKIVEGIAVDTHVLRLSQRLRLVDIDDIGGKKAIYTGPLIDFKKDADPVKIEKQLVERIPKNMWFTTTYLLIDHGRAVCKARKPDCNNCVLAAHCPVSRV